MCVFEGRGAEIESKEPKCNLEYKVSTGFAQNIHRTTNSYLFSLDQEFSALVLKHQFPVTFDVSNRPESNG